MNYRAVGLVALAVIGRSVFAEKPSMSCAGGWQVHVTCDAVSAVLTVDPPDTVAVADERYDTLAVFQGPVWRRGPCGGRPRHEAEGLPARDFSRRGARGHHYSPCNGRRRRRRELTAGRAESAQFKYCLLTD